MVQRQDQELSGIAEFQMRGAAEEKDPSPHECRDLGLKNGLNQELREQWF